MSQIATLKRTPLFSWHREAGARLVGFAGWEMPVHYTGVLEEHAAVRERAGLFDVSHMGELQVAGAAAESLLQLLTPNDVARLADGQAQYSALLTDRGTYLDDLLVYRRSASDFMVVVNAANTSLDLDWVRQHAGRGTRVEDVSDRTALLALQGPAAVGVLSPLVDGSESNADVASLGSFDFLEGSLLGARVLISRTGYTGEDGFEIYVGATDALRVWEGLLDHGESAGLVPVGLAARDTLRLEAGLMLHGNDIDDTVTPFEAGLGWVVKMNKGDFVGRSALAAQRESGVPRKLIGFELGGRRIARHGAKVLADGGEAGHVTSGTWSPTLERPIGMALVSAQVAGQQQLAVDIRGREQTATVVKLPFYRRAED